MPQDHGLHGFNRNVDEWNADGLHYETLAICRQFAFAPAVFPRSLVRGLLQHNPPQRDISARFRGAACQSEPARRSPACSPSALAVPRIVVPQSRT
jgi:hypothetical protein